MTDDSYDRRMDLATLTGECEALFRSVLWAIGAARPDLAVDYAEDGVAMIKQRFPDATEGR